MRIFIDEMGHCLTEAMLRQEFELLKLEQPEEYNYTFEEYIKNCLGKNGTLTELCPRAQEFKKEDFENFVKTYL